MYGERRNESGFPEISGCVDVWMCVCVCVCVCVFVVINANLCQMKNRGINVQIVRLMEIHVGVIFVDGYVFLTLMCITCACVCSRLCACVCLCLCVYVPMCVRERVIVFVYMCA